MLLRAAIRVSSAVAPPLAVRLVQALFFTPQRLSIRPEQRVVLTGGQRHTWRVTGEQIAGWVWGNGPTVALVHGWSAHAAFMTALVEPLVQAGFRVVGWDMPAHGISSGRYSSLVQYAATLEHVAGALGPLHGIVAHSLGTTATLYACARGLTVERAALVSPPARLHPLWARVRGELGVPEPIWNRMLAQAERRLATDFTTLEPLALAPRVTLPLLVLHDADDQEIPVSDGETLAHHLPQATLRRTSGLGHRRILRDPASIAAIVRFLAHR